MTKRGPLPGSEAAQRGGRAVRDKYGPDYFARIGKAGGETLRERGGTAHYAAIGRKGGRATKARYGAEHYARIARRGGDSRPAASAPLAGGARSSPRADQAQRRRPPAPSRGPEGDGAGPPIRPADAAPRANDGPAGA